MGAPSINDTTPTLVTQTSFEYTATTSTFVQTAGGVTLNVKFTSPITPDDFQAQSVIGSYLEVSVASNDGVAHDVQLYADTSAGT